MDSLGTVEGRVCTCEREQSALRAEMAQLREELEARVRQQEQALARALASLLPAVEALSAKMDQRPSRAPPRSSAETASPCRSSAPSSSAAPNLGTADLPATQPAPAAAPNASISAPASSPTPALPALHAAAKAGDADAVRRLLAQGEDPTARGACSESALYYAAATGHVAALDALLEAVPDGADRARWTQCTANVRGRLARTPLHAAAAAGHVDAACSLLEAGASVHATDAEGSSPLHLAAAGGHCEVAKLLLAEGAAVDARKKKGATPLFVAASFGHAPFVRLLLEIGADPHISTVNLHTILHAATLQGNREIVQLLLEKGLNVRVENDDGATPLHIAAACGHVELIDMLLAKGSLIDGLAGTNETALLVATVAGHAEAVVKLLAKGASVKEEGLLEENADNFDLWHLVQAARGGSARVVKALFLAGASSQVPVMQLAIECAQNAEVVWALLDIDPDKFRKAAEIALHCLAITGNAPALKAVLATGVELSKTHLDKALRIAAKNNRAECVAALLDAGVTVEKQIALHEAVKYGHKRCVSEFLQRGVTDEQKIKALAIAKENYQVEVMGMLVEAGANPFMVDSEDVWALIKRFQERKMQTRTSEVV